MTCKEICKKYKAIRGDRGDFYPKFKRCNKCDIFINWEGNFCPCCGYRLRHKPRASKYRKAILAEQIRY